MTFHASIGVVITNIVSTPDRPRVENNFPTLLNIKYSKLSLLVRMSQDDYRCILERNVRQICARCNVSEIGLWQKWKVGKLSVFNTDEMNECEQVIEMMTKLYGNGQRIICRCKWF